MRLTRTVFAFSFLSLVAACGGVVELEGTHATTSTGGGGAATAASTGSATGSATTGSGVTSAGGTPGCTKTCAEAVVNGGVPCGETPPEQYGQYWDYKELHKYVCPQELGGPCSEVCATSFCKGAAADAACFNCLKDGCCKIAYLCLPD